MLKKSMSWVRSLLASLAVAAAIGTMGAAPAFADEDEDVVTVTPVTVTTPTTTTTVTSTSSSAPTNGTDVQTPGSGNAFIKVAGTYENVDSISIVSRINAIRTEAYREGFVDEYVPVTWSPALAWGAEIRAAEASVSQSHTRPNGSSFSSVIPSKIRSGSVETLAYNTSGISRAVEQWYSQKDDYRTAFNNSRSLKAGSVVNYAALIDPELKYVGIGAFRQDAADSYAVSMLMTEKDQNTSIGYVSGKVSQLIVVRLSDISDFRIVDERDADDSAHSGMNANTSIQLRAEAKIAHEENSDYIRSGKYYDLTDSVTWTSSNPVAIAVDQSGKVTALANSDETTITATLGTKSDSKSLHVHQTVTDPRVEPTCEDAGLTEGSHCKVCGEVFTAQQSIAPLGHVWDDGVYTKAATQKVPAIKTYTCTVCGAHKTDYAEPENGTVIKAGSFTYKILSVGDNKTCEVTKVNSKAAKITIPAVATLGKSYKYKVVSIAAGACRHNTKVQTLVIGKNVETIGEKAFMTCGRLTAVTIGSGVKTIGAQAFYKSRKLAKVSFKGTVLENVGSQAFGGVSSSCRFVMKGTKKADYRKLLTAEAGITGTMKVG